MLIAGSQPPDAADAGAAVGVGADATAATAGTAGTAVLLDRLAPPPATVTRITTFLSAVAKEMHGGSVGHGGRAQLVGSGCVLTASAQ